jgi:hypothetical protein
MISSVLWDIDEVVYHRWVVDAPATRLILSPVVYDDFKALFSEPVETLKSRYGTLTVETHEALPPGSWTVV